MTDKQLETSFANRFLSEEIAEAVKERLIAGGMEPARADQEARGALRAAVDAFVKGGGQKVEDRPKLDLGLPEGEAQ